MSSNFFCNLWGLKPVQLFHVGEKSCYRYFRPFHSFMLRCLVHREFLYSTQYDQDEERMDGISVGTIWTNTGCILRLAHSHGWPIVVLPGKKPKHCKRNLLWSPFLNDTGTPTPIQHRIVAQLSQLLALKSRQSNKTPEKISPTSWSLRSLHISIYTFLGNIEKSEIRHQICAWLILSLSKI